jgi:hypothetical protein
VSIQQEWDRVVANDPAAFNKLSSAQKAKVVRRFVQAEAGKYGGGRNPSVKQFLETKLNEYQPVEGYVKPGPEYGPRDPRQFGPKMPAPGDMASYREGREEGLKSGIIPQVLGIVSGKPVQQNLPTIGESLESLGRQALGDIPYQAPDVEFARGAIQGQLQEPAAEIATGLLAARMAGPAAAARGIGALGQKAIQAGTGFVTGGILPGAATGLGYLAAPTPAQKQQVLDVGLLPTVLGSTLGAAGGLTEKVIAPAVGKYYSRTQPRGIPPQGPPPPPPPQGPMGPPPPPQAPPQGPVGPAPMGPQPIGPAPAPIAPVPAPATAAGIDPARATLIGFYQDSIQKNNATAVENIRKGYAARYGTDIDQDIMAMAAPAPAPAPAGLMSQPAAPGGPMATLTTFPREFAGQVQEIKRAPRQAQPPRVEAPPIRQAVEETTVRGQAIEPEVPAIRSVVEPEAPVAKAEASAPAPAKKPAARKITTEELKRKSEDADVNAAAAEVRFGKDSPELNEAVQKAVAAKEQYSNALARETKLRETAQPKGIAVPEGPLERQVIKSIKPVEKPTAAAQAAPTRQVIKSIKPVEPTTKAAPAEAAPKGLMSEGAPKPKAEAPKLQTPAKPVKKKEVTAPEAKQAEVAPTAAKPEPKKIGSQFLVLRKYGRGLQEAARTAESESVRRQAREILELAKKNDELNTAKANQEFYTALENSDDFVFKAAKKFEGTRMLDESVVSKTKIPDKYIDLEFKGDFKVVTRDGYANKYNGTVEIPKQDRGYAWQIYEYDDGSYRYRIQNTKINKGVHTEFGRDRRSLRFNSKEEAEKALAKELDKIWRLETVGVKPNRAAQIRSAIKQNEASISFNNKKLQEIEAKLKDPGTEGWEASLLRKEGVGRQQDIFDYQTLAKDLKKELESIEAAKKLALSEEPKQAPSKEKKLISKEGGEPTDSIIVNFIKQEDGFFDPKALSESIARGLQRGRTGLGEIVAVVKSLLEKVRNNGIVSFLAKSLPKIGNIVESGGKFVTSRVGDFTGDILVNYAMRGKTPESRAFARKIGEILKRPGADNAEALKRILRTPAKTTSESWNAISNAARRFFIGEYGMSKELIDAAQAIENEIYTNLRSFLENAVYIQKKYGTDEDALIQFGKDVENPSYVGDNIDVYTTKALVQQVSKWMLDVGAITENAYKAYGEMGNYLPRIYRKWAKLNPDNQKLSWQFFQEIAQDPVLAGYVHRGNLETMTRAKLEKELADGVEWKELRTIKKSEAETTATQKALDKANEALEEAKENLKEAIKKRNKANGMTPAADGSDASALKAIRTKAIKAVAKAEERLSMAEKNVNRAKSTLEKAQKNEKVEVWRDWTEEEMNKWKREWNPIPSMVKMYDTALRELKSGRMLEHLRTGSDNAGRYAKTPEELGVELEKGKAPPDTFTDDAGQNWVYLSPTEKASGGTIPKYGKLGGSYVRDDIKAYLAFHNQNSGFRTFMRLAKRYTGMNWFKENKTVWSTTYYVNNFANAMPMVELAGGSVTDMPMAIREIMSNSDTVKLLERENVIRSGMMARELASAAESVIKKGLEADGVVTHVNAANALHRAAMRLGKTKEQLRLISQATDDMWRVTLYNGLRNRQKLSHEEAVKIVRDAIYDSKRVTSPAADVAEVAIPFVKATTWMLEQTVVNSIRNPHKLAYLYAIGSIIPGMMARLQASKDRLEAEEEAIEPYLKDVPVSLGWPTKIRLFQIGDTAYYWDTKNFGGLHSMAAEVGNSGFTYWPQGLNFGGPWWVFTQAYMNRDAFREQDIRIRDGQGREITIDRNFLFDPVAEFIVKGLSPSGIGASWEMGKAMAGIPTQSGRMISPWTKLFSLAGFKIREVNLAEQAPLAIGQSESDINKWKRERGKAVNVLERLYKENAPQSSIESQLETINKWDEKIREITEEEANRMLKLQKGLASD